MSRHAALLERLRSDECLNPDQDALEAAAAIEALERELDTCEDRTALAETKHAVVLELLTKAESALAAMTVERDALQRFFNTITDTNLTASRAELDARDALLDRARPWLLHITWSDTDAIIPALLRDIDARKGGA